MSQAGILSIGGGGGVVDSITATAPLTANGVSGTPETGAVTVALTTPLVGTYGGTGVNNAALTITLASGGVGKVLTSDSSGNGTWATAAMPNYSLTPVNHAASPYTVLSTDVYLQVDSTAGVVTLNFPNTTGTGRGIVVKDSTGQAAAHNITLTTPGGTVTFDGSTSYVMNLAYESLTLVFDGSGYEII